MDIVIPTGYLNELTNHILGTKDVETHAFLFGAFLETKILIGRLWKTPPQMYDARSPVKVELKQNYIVQALEYARHNKFALIDVHSHPWANSAEFSSIDDKYGLENAAWVKQKSDDGVFPKVPWGMILVAGSKRMTARVYDFKKESFAQARIRTPLDFGLQTEVQPSEMFNRQIKLWGMEGQKRLNNLKVAIIGLGGLGALFCEQLARMGVRQFTLIDGDRVELTNLNRLSGFFLDHVGSKKADICALNIKRIAGINASVRVIHRFLSRRNLPLLQDQDLLIGAVDRDGARLLANEAAIRFLIPYVDIGTGIKADREIVTQMGGQIRFVNPGTAPCLQCYTKGIDPFEAALDLMSKEDIQLRRELGYIEGTLLSPEPSVIPLNGVLASLASQEISKLVTGFHRTFLYISYNGLDNEIKILDKEAELRRQKNCPVCGIGGLLGVGKNTKQAYVLPEEHQELAALNN